MPGDTPVSTTEKIPKPPAVQKAAKKKTVKKSGKKSKAPARAGRVDLQKVVNEKIARVDKVPPDFVDLAEFSRRCNVSKSAISQAKGSGRLLPENLLFLVQAKKSDTLYIHWGNEGEKYILQMPREKWPKDFKPTHPVPDKDKPEVPTGPTLADAKLKQAELDIKKRELELLKANNDVLSIEEMAETLQELGGSIKGHLLAIPPRLAPTLAAEKNVQTVHRMLEQEILATLKILSELDLYSAGAAA